MTLVHPAPHCVTGLGSPLLTPRRLVPQPVTSLFLCCDLLAPSTPDVGLGTGAGTGVSGLGVPTPWHLGMGFKEAAFWPQAEGTNLVEFLALIQRLSVHVCTSMKVAILRGIGCLLWAGNLWALGKGTLTFPTPTLLGVFHFAWSLASDAADLNMGLKAQPTGNLCTQE